MTNLEWTGPWHRRLGAVELMVVTDRTYMLDGGAFFGVVPKPLWSRQAPADDQNRIRSGLNSLVVRPHGAQGTLDGALTLIETGCGNKLSEKQMRYGGVDPRRDYLERLAAAGVDPAQVDVVINTHLHYDHCGWNTLRHPDTGQLMAAFPKARYYVQRREWEHAREQHERDRVSYLTENYDPLVRSGQMTLLEGDRELLPGITVECWPGHTRGLQGVLIRSQGETACYVSDLIPTHWHLKPSWVMGFDLFPLESIDNKHRVLERAIREHWLMVFTHDPEHAWGYVERGGGGYVFVPA
ncbi:MAG TPA: MBL fold metallo-hydrolase [Terriglobales bacterium]|nr:MBL fold metallo-hydrolase [Terriglobales bacterium]